VLGDGRRRAIDERDALQLVHCELTSNTYTERSSALAAIVERLEVRRDAGGGAPRHSTASAVAAIPTASRSAGIRRSLSGYPASARLKDPGPGHPDLPVYRLREYHYMACASYLPRRLGFCDGTERDPGCSQRAVDVETSRCSALFIVLSSSRGRESG